jgi:hypothetical protein
MFREACAAIHRRETPIRGRATSAVAENAPDRPLFVQPKAIGAPHADIINLLGRRALTFSASRICSPRSVRSHQRTAHNPRTSLVFMSGAA